MFLCRKTFDPLLLKPFLISLLGRQPATHPSRLFRHLPYCITLLQQKQKYTDANRFYRFFISIREVREPFHRCFSLGACTSKSIRPLGAKSNAHNPGSQSIDKRQSKSIEK